MSAHILVIDDQKTWLQNLAFVLRHKNYQVTAVASGKEGLVLLQTDPARYSVLLLDLMLEDISGLEIIATLQSNNMTQKIPVILQTGSEETATIMEAITLGALCCIRKPYNHRMLYPLLEGVLNGIMPEEKILSLSMSTALTSVAN